MPLIKGKSPASFEHNIKAEVKAGKPLKQSLAIAYSMKRKAAQKKAMGGFIDEEEASGYKPMPMAHEPYNTMAMEEDEKKLGQHGAKEMGPMGVPPNKTKMMAKGGLMEDPDYAEAPDTRAPEEHNEHDIIEAGTENKDFELENQKKQPSAIATYAHGDMVGRIMAKKYSMGGKVANGGDDELDMLADGSPNEFDDLALRDDLKSTYGEDNNSGDETGDKQEDRDRADMVARILRSRMKKDKLPRPA